MSAWSVVKIFTKKRQETSRNFLEFFGISMEEEGGVE